MFSATQMAPFWQPKHQTVFCRTTLKSSVMLPRQKNARVSGDGQVILTTTQPSFTKLLQTFAALLALGLLLLAPNYLLIIPMLLWSGRPKGRPCGCMETPASYLARRFYLRTSVHSFQFRTHYRRQVSVPFSLCHVESPSAKNHQDQLYGI